MNALKSIYRWIVLVIFGWFDYGLLLALAAIIQFGVAWYDWLWYVSLIVFVSLTPIYLLQMIRSGKRIILLTIILSLFVLIVDWNGLGQTEKLSTFGTAPISISFWAEYPIADQPDFVLRDIQATQGRLFLGVGGDITDVDHRREVASALHKLDEFGIDVYLAVPAGNNFLSAPVYREWIANVRRAIEFLRDEQFDNVRGVIGDVEPPVGYALDVSAVDRMIFFDMVEGFRNLIDEVHRADPDLEIGATAMWMHYADALDGDADLSVLFRSTVDPPGGWDFINLMTYSSYLPSEQQLYYVYLSERAMVVLYPDEDVSHLIGLIGTGLPGEPLADFENVARDARLSRALGVSEVAVFHLNGALDLWGDDFIARLNDAVNREDVILDVPFSREVSLSFFGVRVLDALLDVRGDRAWLFIVLAIAAWRLKA